MPITEFATVELLAQPDTTTPNPLSASSLQDRLRLVAEKQSAVSGYPLFFFTSLRSDSNPCPNGTIFYLLSGWTSVATHHEWIQSQTNQDLLTLLKDDISVKGLAHVDIDFDEIMTNVGLGGYGNKSESMGGVLVISTVNGMPEQTTSPDRAWVKEGICLDGDKPPKYRFAWVPGGIVEAVNVLNMGKEVDEVEVMKRIEL